MYVLLGDPGYPGPPGQTGHKGIHGLAYWCFMAIMYVQVTREIVDKEETLVIEDPED